MVNQQIHLGVTGAKRQSYRYSGRQHIANLMKRHPGLSRMELLEKFLTILRSDATLIDSVGEYYFDNNFRSLMKKKSRRRPIKDEVAEVESIIRRGLLDFVTPIGKRLADCTGAECVKLGGWFERVGRVAGLKNRVGDVVTNDELAGMLSP